MSRSLLSLISSLFCKPVDNLFSLEKYADGSLFMAGDTVEISSVLPLTRTGKIVRLNQHRHIDNFRTYTIEVDINGKVHRKCPGKLIVIKRQQSLAAHWKKIYEGDSYYKKYLEVEKAKQEEYLAKPFVADRVALHAPRNIFLHGLDVLRADADRDLARSLFELVLTSSGYLLENEKHCRDSIEWPRVLCLRAYAQALTGQGMERELLLRAVTHLRDRSESLSPNDWWAGAQDDYLSAVRMAMLANDMDLARELLKSKRSFSRHKDQRMLLKKLARKSIHPKSDAELEKNCLLYLDYVKSPFSLDCNWFSSTWTALEWGAIVDKMFYADDRETIDWNEVISKIYR